MKKSNKVASDGAGATFPAPLYQAWFQTYATTGGHRVNYQAVGSGSCGARQKLLISVPAMVL